MARASTVFCLCLMAMALSLHHIHAQDICQYDCVVDVYSTHCGGSTCVSSFQPGMEQQLCNRRCIDALAGGPLTNCLASTPTFGPRASELAGSVSTSVEGFCVGIGFEITDEAPPSVSVEGPDASASLGPSTVGDGPDASASSGPAAMVDGPDSTVEEKPEPPVAPGSEEAVPGPTSYSSVAPDSEEPSSDAPSSDAPLSEPPSSETPETEPIESPVEAETPEASEPAEDKDLVPTPSEESPEEALESEDAMESDESVEPSDAPPSSAESPDFFASVPAPAIEVEAIPSSDIAFDFDDMEEEMLAILDVF